MENDTTVSIKKGKSSIILIVVTIIALAVAGYMYYQLNVFKKNPQAIAQKEAAELVSKVSKLIVLPSGETPTVATVSDPEALKDQAFFNNAQKGDKVLIYAVAKKAVLYSVTLNKIIDVAPLSIGSSNKSAVNTAPVTDTTKKSN